MIQKVKAAFYIQLADLVEKQLSHAAEVTEHYLDVHIAPYVFRVVIFVDRELHLLKRTQANLESAVASVRMSGIAQPDIIEAAERAAYRASEVEKSFVLGPKMAGLMHALQLQHPAFSPSVRLFKRWVSAPWKCSGG